MSHAEWRRVRRPTNLSDELTLCPGPHLRSHVANRRRGRRDRRVALSSTRRKCKRPIVEAAASRAAPDADHRRVDQLVLEDRQHGPALLLLEGAERVVEHNPAGPVQQKARESQALLFLQGQTLVPTLLAIECEQQMAKPDPRERGSDGRVIEAPG